MNIIPIPKQFHIFGELHKVKQLKIVKDGEEFVLGLYNPDTNIIKIQKASETRNQDQVEQTFFHELVHASLGHLSYDKLYEDEVFVDNMAKALHQAFKTAKY